MLALLRQGGTWEELARRHEADRQRAGTFTPLSRGAVQYRLPDGRIIEADAFLYEGGLLP